MTSQWTSHEQSLCLIIPKLASAGALQLPKENEKSADIISPKSAISSGALKTFQNLTTVFEQGAIEWDQVEPTTVIAWRYLDVLSALLPASNYSHMDTFYEQLVSLLVSVSRHTAEMRLAGLTGKTLALLSHVKPGKKSETAGITSAQLVDLFEAFGKNSTFLSGAHDYLKLVGVKMFSKDELTRLSDSLIQRLTSSSGDVRRISLYILDLLNKSITGKSSDLIRTACMVEEIPLAISNQRNLAMYARKLGMDYHLVGKDSWEYRIVPYYCFGLMTAKFSPLWEESSKALAQVAQVNEEIVAELAFKWLSGVGLDDESAPQQTPEDPHMTLTPFECSNLKTFEKNSGKCISDDFSAKAELDNLFAADSQIPIFTITTARAQALYVLCEIPEIAEKRSRTLVPMFLEWSRMISEDAELDAEDDVEAEPESTTESTIGIKWSRQSQSAMLTLFFQVKIHWRARLWIFASPEAASLSKLG